MQCQRSYADDWHNEQPFIERVAQDMCKLNKADWRGCLTVGLYGINDTEYATHHAWQALNNTSFNPGEKYAGVRWANEEERNTLQAVFVVLKLQS